MGPRVVKGTDLPKHFEASGKEGWYVLYYEGSPNEITYGPYDSEEEAKAEHDIK
jgi:hypothetical protein